MTTLDIANAINYEASGYEIDIDNPCENEVKLLAFCKKNLDELKAAGLQVKRGIGTSKKEVLISDSVFDLLEENDINL